MKVYEFSNIEELSKYFYDKGQECRGEAEFYRAKNKLKAEARCLVRAAIWEEAAGIAGKTVLSEMKALSDATAKAAGAGAVHHIDSEINRARK